MTAANNLTWNVYRDGDRFIVGAAEWQTATSVTVGVAAAHTADEARKLIRRARVTNSKRLDEIKRIFWTDARFENLEEAGHFGAAW